MKPNRSIRIRGLLLTIAASLLVTAPVAFGGAILDTGKKLYSQHDEELIVRDFFNDRKDGVFLDVGSFQWKDFSTTYYLEHHLNWSGLAIDAQPGLAEGYEKNRPKTKFFSYAVSDTSGDKMTFYLGGQMSSSDPDWLKQFPNAAGAKKVPVEVTTITLNDLLAQNSIEHVNFLSMDIEGGEPAALKGFDIDKYKPELICIEASPSIREPILAYFAEHKYEQIKDYLKRDTVNWYFRPLATGAAAPAPADTK